MTDRDLTPLQLDILELEHRKWSRPGEKISAFRQMHPHVTETGYYVALLVLMRTPAAYEVDDERYAAMLHHLTKNLRDRIIQRVGFRSVAADL